MSGENNDTNQRGHGGFGRRGSFRGNSGERGRGGRGGVRGGYSGRGGGGRRGGFNEHRGGRGGGGGGRWNHQSWSSSVPASAPATPARPAEEIIEFWSNSSALPLPEEPFKFEPPETDFHLETLEFMQGFRNERKLLLDDNGEPCLDCRGSHGFDRMCQFCDGRRGPWVNQNPRHDPAFQRYQDSIVMSRASHFARSTKVDPNSQNSTGNVLQMVPEEWTQAIEEEEEFGLLDKNRSIFE